MTKTAQNILQYKREYYLRNKERILAKKKERGPLNYLTKKLRLQTSEKAYEREQLGILARKYYTKKSCCELCAVVGPDLMILNIENGPYTLCRKCHIEMRRIRN